MSTIFKKIPLSELGKLEKQLAKQFRPAALRALKAAQGPIIAELKKQTKNAVPASNGPNSRPGAVAFGKLLEGWNADIELHKTSVRGRALGALEVYNTQDYAKYVEAGVLNSSSAPSSHQDSPSFQAIQAWVNRRLGVGDVRASRALTSKIIRAMKKRTGTYRFNPRGLVEKARARLAVIAKKYIMQEVERVLKEAK